MSAAPVARDPNASSDIDGQVAGEVRDLSKKAGGRDLGPVEMQLGELRGKLPKGWTATSDSVRLQLRATHPSGHLHVTGHTVDDVLRRVAALPLKR